MTKAWTDSWGAPELDGERVITSTFCNKGLLLIRRWREELLVLGLFAIRLHGKRLVDSQMTLILLIAVVLRNQEERIKTLNERTLLGLELDQRIDFLEILVPLFYHDCVEMMQVVTVVNVDTAIDKGWLQLNQLAGESTGCTC